MINRQGHSAMRQFRWRNTKSPWPVTFDLYIYNVAIPILHQRWNVDVFDGSGYDWNATCCWVKFFQHTIFDTSYVEVYELWPVFLQKHWQVLEAACLHQKQMCQDFCWLGSNICSKRPVISWTGGGGTVVCVVFNTKRTWDST